jgi:hypothetical protein
VFSFLAEHRFELFPPEVVASALALQAPNGLSDRVAAEAVT